MKEREVNMSANDWLQIVRGVRYCWRWGIFAAAMVFTSLAGRWPRKPCSP
jgi:hypothetical protein